MLNTNLPIYLASKSPRRKKLLKQLGLNFKSFSVDLDEVFIENESPIKTVKRLAKEKLYAAENIKDDGILITADTIVVLGKEIIGKPRNNKDAKLILNKLSNNKHLVYTGFAVKNCITNKEVIDYKKTEVTFRKLTTIEIENYISGGSPMDKAGAYGIQDDFGAVFISKINGCYYNVVGLPLSKLYTALNEVLWLKAKISKNIFISILVLIAIYILLSFYSNYNLVLSTLASFKWKFFPIILSLIYISFLLKFIKWQYYLKLTDVKIKLSDSFQIFMASLTMSVTPGKIGDIIKSYMIKELNGTPTSSTIPIVFAEKVTEIFALIFLVLVGLGIQNRGIIIPITALLILLLFVFLVLNQNTGTWLLKKLDGIKLLQKYIKPLHISLQNSRIVLSPKPFAFMFFMSLIIWLIECISFYLILIKFDISISLVSSFFTYLFSIFIGSISFLPAGLGITDGSIALLLSNSGISNEIAISSAFIIRIATLWFALIVGGISMFNYNQRLKKSKNM